MRLLYFLLLISLTTSAQTDLGLSAYYPFESNLGDATGEPTNLGSPEGAIDYDCGVLGEAVLLGGPGDFVRIPGGATNNVNREFDDEDFTVSFYFKSLDSVGQHYLLAKRATNCAVQPAFFIRYDVAPAPSLSNSPEPPGRSPPSTIPLPISPAGSMSCWYATIPGYGSSSTDWR